MTWRCKSCGHSVEWSYEDLAQRGVPICGQGDCAAADSDMELLPGPVAAQAGQVLVRFECGSEDRVSGQYGPFSFVQLTYNTLRAGPDSDDLAYAGSDGFWRVGDDRESWSDVVIAGAACDAPGEVVGLLEDARRRPPKASITLYEVERKGRYHEHWLAWSHLDAAQRAISHARELGLSLDRVTVSAMVYPEAAGEGGLVYVVSRSVTYAVVSGRVRQRSERS